MERLEHIERLVALLLDDMPEYREQAATFSHEVASQRRLLRGLMNLRIPGKPLAPEYLRLQDELLSRERLERGAVDAAALPRLESDGRLSLWRGDITRLGADAIVNAANSALLGCFVPCHGCIDNAIHSAAGLQLRDECYRIMSVQGHEEPNGQAKITGGYNLLARHVLHTVGPIVSLRVTRQNRRDLASCYRSCLELSLERGLTSVAFCCISTGEFHFPNQEAAQIAVREVRDFLDAHPEHPMHVVFNVFTEQDLQIYRDLLGEDATA